MNITKTWSDMFFEEIVNAWLYAIEEKRRLVTTGLYTEKEFLELCSFIKWRGLWKDYSGRFLWCKEHNVIERRGRTIWSQLWYDSPVDEIITVYGTKDINVKGYKKGKHVLELHFNGLNTWDDYKREILDKYHLCERNPDFIGRRDTVKGINWIGDGTGIFGDIEKWILKDESIEKLHIQEKNVLLR